MFLIIMSKQYRLLYNFNKTYPEHVFKLFDKNMFVGCVGCVDRDNYTKISMLFVEEQHQRRGHGTFLLNSILDFQKHRNYDILFVEPSIESVPFYYRNGFTTTRSLSLINKFRYKNGIGIDTYYKKIDK
jgi:GNAT superfamily N-acetyltransferase